MSAADVIVMVLYGAVVLGIGFWANRRQKDSEDYFLGGRKLRWWAVGISLVATSFSSASLIGGTGFGYANGLGYLQWQIGDLIAILIVCAIFLPFFAAQPITTAYEWLEHRFGRRARVVGSLLFLAQTAVRASVLVYGPALAIQAVLGWSVESSILLSATAAIAYSAFGGIAAVVWTDCIQFGVILFAVIAALFMVGSDVPGGFGAIVDHAREHERLNAITFSADPKSPFNLLASVVPYMFLALSLFGTGQQAVQRFLSCQDLKSARRAALTGWLAGTIALSITLLLGVAIFAWQELAPAAEGFALDKGDKVLPTFLVARMPAGMAGLMLAAIFAASMSSLDSAVHSMSTSFLVDIVRRRDLRLARVATIGVGVIATFGALAAARSESGMLLTMASWLAYFAGPMLALFLLGMLTKVTENAALIGVAAGGLLVLVLAWYRTSLPFHRLWLCPISCIAAMLTGLAAARIRRA
ncbi:MAG: sodium:solute symporter family transporter [Planctomycetota bacterium]|jgi:SSS family solute:Na+ symporter